MPHLRTAASAAALLALAGVALPAGAQAAAPNTTSLLDRPTSGPLPSDGLNYSIYQSQQSLTADGNRAVFESEADGLLAAGVDPSKRYVFVRDRAAGTTTNVCASSAGVVGNAGCSGIAISANGQWVAFRSSSTNLVAGNPTGQQLYRRNLSTGVTDLVSRREGVAGAIMTGFASGAPSIADNGTVVFATSDALDPAVDLANSRDDIYTRTVDGHTRLVSRLASPAGAVGNGHSDQPAISADGSTVVFRSAATNFQMVADTNGATDIYVTNTTGSITPTLISRRTAANEAGNGASSEPSISQSGQFVSFTTEATNLFSAPITTDANGYADIVVRDRISNTNTVATISPSGVQSNAEVYASVLSPDGSAVAFSSTATSLGSPGGQASVTILRKLGANTTSVVSRVDGGGAIVRGGPAGLSTSGSAVAFGASDYPGLANSTLAFVAVPGSSLTELVSRPSGTGPVDAGAGYTNMREVGAVDRSGRFVVFSSETRGLAPGDGDGRPHVYLRDNLRGTTTLLDRAASGNPANGFSGEAIMSRDGSTVAFFSDATDLVADATDGDTHVIVGRIAADGTLTGMQAADRGAGAPAGGLGEGGFGLNESGTAVVFSTSKQLVAADNNAVRDIYVRNLAAGTTTLVSRADGPDGPVGTATSQGGLLSADGTKVAFASAAANLVPGDAGGKTDVFVRDLAAGTTVLVSRAPGGAQGNDHSALGDFSADGARVSFMTESTNLGGATNGRRAVYLRDVAASTTTWISAPAGGAQPDGDSSGGAMSADAAQVAFTSEATNIATTDTNGATEDGFVRSAAAGTTTRIAVADGADGAQPSQDVENLALSGDGRCAVFSTKANNLVTGGYASADFLHLYLRVIGGECPVPPAAPTCPNGAAPSCPEIGSGTPKDAVAPTLTGLKLSKKSLTTKGKKKGTKLTFTLSEPATIKLEIAKTTPGRKKGKSCVAPGKAKKGAKKCTRVGKPKSLPSVKGAAGKNTVAISGKVGKKALPKGSYRLLLTAADAAGNVMKSPAQIDLRIK